MAENLSTLAIAAIDELTRIKLLRILLEAALDQLDHDLGETELKVEVLLSCYLSQSKPHFEDLELTLERIRRLINSKEQL